MSRFRAPPSSAVTLVVCALMLTACSSSGLGPSVAPEASAVPSIRPDDIVGRWGYAVYYNVADRPRIETAARAQCNRPAVIARGPAGGLMMPIANHEAAQEQMIKGGPGGKNYIGPPGEAGGQQDIEIVSFDGKILVTRTVAADETGHLNSVYVRCGPKV